MDIQSADTSGLAAKVGQLKPVKEKQGFTKDHVKPYNRDESEDSSRDKPQKDDRHREADHAIFEGLGIVTAGQKPDEPGESDGHILDVKA